MIYLIDMDDDEYLPPSSDSECTEEDKYEPPHKGKSVLFQCLLVIPFE